MIRYYPYELHTHTIHSDGSMSPTELVATARKQGLSGIALTDHNAVTGVEEAVKACEGKSFNVIPGVEWTTFYGHLTVLGGNTKINYQEVNPSNVLDVIKKVRAEGDIIGIAHPYRIGYPICTGGSNDFNISDYSGITHYEVWSYLSPQKEITNELADREYLRLIEHGNKIACVYGRDFHKVEDGAYAATYLGFDGENNTKNAIEAIKSGRTYISLGLMMEASLKKDGKEYHIGSTVKAGSYLFKLMLLPVINFCNKYGVSMETLTLEGSALEAPIVRNIATGGYGALIDITPGYFRIKVTGKVEGEQGTLLISTPFYVE